MVHPFRHLYLHLYRLLYSQLAWSYDGVSWLVSLGRWSAWRRAALAFVVGSRVLEVGFGTGELLPLLARGEGRRAIGLEASAAMQVLTARKLGRQRHTIPRVQGLVQYLPFATGSVDTVVTTFPAAFILDPAAHREFARVLAPGGRLVVVDVVWMGGNPLLQILHHLVFPPAPEAEERFQAASAEAGLCIARHMVGSGPVRAVVTVGEKAL